MKASVITISPIAARPLSKPSTLPRPLTTRSEFWAAPEDSPNFSNVGYVPLLLPRKTGSSTATRQSALGSLMMWQARCQRHADEIISHGWVSRIRYCRLCCGRCDGREPQTVAMETTNLRAAITVTRLNTCAPRPGSGTHGAWRNSCPQLARHKLY